MGTKAGIKFSIYSDDISELEPNRRFVREAFSIARDEFLERAMRALDASAIESWKAKAAKCEKVLDDMTD